MTRTLPVRHSLLALLIFSLPATIVQADPGLVAVYADGEQTVHRVVPTPNFSLATEESVHSQINPKFDAIYSGVLIVQRAGEYVISGDAKIEVGGEVVAGKALQLAAGEHPLKITYARKDGPARLQLRWQSDFFINEPIPPAAFGHQAEGDAAVRKWAQVEHGRMLYENLSCGACHGAGGWDLTTRQAPDLSNIGGRVTNQWLTSWLKNPHHYRKSSAMPVLLKEEGEISDVAAYLSSLKQTPDGLVASKPNSTRMEAGASLFDTIGCKQCHSDTEHSLAGVGSKFTSSQALAAFLIDPLHVDPSGRMPRLFDPKTQTAEAALVAEYLFHTHQGEGVEAKPSHDGDAARGRKLVQSSGCTSCHTVRDEDRPLTNEATAPRFAAAQWGAKDQLAKFDARQGCLAEAPAGRAPNFQLSDEQRTSLRALLQSHADHPVVAKAPVETFHRRVAQFNCTACHTHNDENAGPAQEVTEDGKIRAIERPPSLTGAGDKLRVEWLQAVLLGGKRTRPWMKMRMPHFGDELKDLPHHFSAASGNDLVDEAPLPDIKIAQAGLETIGHRRGKVACINCHNYRGVNRQTEGVVPAPDMAEIGKTLRHDWFRRWLHDPPRMQPGTSMPQFFVELKSDEREKRIDELWAALVHQQRLPLPKGLVEQRTEGAQILVGDHPVVFRAATVIPGQVKIDRAINVGLPGGTNYTFDARTAQLRYAWKGQFINASAAWNGRGGNPVSAQGPSLFVAPEGFPLRIGDAEAEPEVRFLGYYLVEKHPIFRYSVDGVEVHERIEVIETELSRRFTILDSAKPIRFIGDKERKYASDDGAFKEGVLTIAAGKKVEFEVRETLELGGGIAIETLKWVPAGTTEPPISKNGPNARVVFENESKGKVKLYWISYAGELQQYGQIDAGGQRSQDTYANNTWLITDESDKPLGYFVAKPLTTHAVIPNKK